jgi:hypothetical protein
MIPEFLAIESSIGYRSVPSHAVIKPLSRDCSSVGISFDGRSVGINEFIPTGFTPMKKKQENIKTASKKFITTPASKTADLANMFFS